MAEDILVSLQSAFELYEKVCENHDIYVGKTISTRERDAKGLTASTLVYGEIMFEPFAIAFQKIKQLYVKKGAVSKGQPLFFLNHKRKYTFEYRREGLQGHIRYLIKRINKL